MSSSFQSGKKAVDLAAPGPRVSRIRRDPPPPPPKVITAAEVREHDLQSIVIGLIIVALCMIVLLVGVGKAAGWSPSQYIVQL